MEKLAIEELLLESGLDWDGRLGDPLLDRPKDFILVERAESVSAGWTIEMKPWVKVKIGKNRWGVMMSFVKRGGIALEVDGKFYDEVASTKQFRAGNPVRYHLVQLRGYKSKYWVHSIRGTWQGARCIRSHHQSELRRLAELCLLVTADARTS